MGIYLNPDNTTYKQITNMDIFVDKSMLLSVTNKLISNGDKYVCMSRPRRFGKSTAAKMLCAYYDKTCDSRELFAGYEIAQDPTYEKHTGSMM